MADGIPPEVQFMLEEIGYLEPLAEKLELATTNTQTGGWSTNTVKPMTEVSSALRQRVASLKQSCAAIGHPIR